MRWHIHQGGFLPNTDPPTHSDHPAFQAFDHLGAALPQLVHDHAFRSKSQDFFAANLDWPHLVEGIDDGEAERLFLLFSYFASAYVHSPGLPAVSRLPAYLAVPLVKLSEIVARPPILSYASYCLHNWRRVGAAGPIALGNIELVQNFSTPANGKQDEDWFILVHVDIEAKAGPALLALANQREQIRAADSQALLKVLQTMHGSLVALNATMTRMPEGCRPEVYFKRVRPYIFGFDNLVYEDCFDEAPQSFRGETGAQSSIIPTFLAALGICHMDSLLTKHLADMRNYMPAPHRQFIEEQPNLREALLRLPSTAAEHRELYNGCIEQIIAFRSRHFEYAVNYIERKVDNPLGTGGTPYVPWLRQLVEETRHSFLT